MNMASLTLDRETWLAERRKGIGGSDVGPIMGLSPHRTAVEIFQDKRGLLPEEPETDEMRWGKTLEPVIRQAYTDRTGLAVLLPDSPTPLKHPQNPFMLANLDGFTETGRIFEAKTSFSAQRWGMEGTDDVPAEYLFQVQHYMAVTGYPVADIAVLIGGNTFRIYTVEADLEIHAMLVEVESEFWRRVQENDPPEPRSPSDCDALWGGVGKKTKRLVASPDIEESVRRLREIKDTMIQLDRAADDEKLKIMREMREAEVLVDPFGMKLATWKTTRSPGDRRTRRFTLK